MLSIHYKKTNIYGVLTICLLSIRYGPIFIKQLKLERTELCSEPKLKFVLLRKFSPKILFKILRLNSIHMRDNQ